MVTSYIKLTQLTPDDNKLTLEVVEARMPPKLDEMQSVVGGLIEPMFTVPSPEGGERMLTGYANEEGLLIGLPMLGWYQDERGSFPFAGNMVITALDYSTGDTVTMTEKETEAVKTIWQDPVIALNML